MQLHQITTEDAAANFCAACTDAARFCRGRMIELHHRTCEAAAGMRAIHRAQAQGYGFDPAAWDALTLFRERADFCRGRLSALAVRWAALNGRWPEADEGEAQARCGGTYDELMGFRDEVSLIPIGFVDVPAVLPTRN